MDAVDAMYDDSDANIDGCSAGAADAAVAGGAAAGAAAEAGADVWDTVCCSSLKMCTVALSLVAHRYVEWR